MTTGNPQLDRAIQEMTQTINTLRSRIAVIERGQRTTQLDSSSLDSGSLTITDDNGDPQLSVGLQADGTYAVVSMTGSPDGPPTPDDPQVVSSALGLTVIWDGLIGQAAPPANFAMVQIHCSTSPVYTPDASTLQGRLATAGLYAIPNLIPGTTYYVCLLAVDTAGNTGAASNIVSGVAGQLGGSFILPGSVNAADVVMPGSVVASNLYVSYAAQVFLDNPIGWWRLDEAPGATAVIDWGTGLHNGTPTSMTFGNQNIAADAMPTAVFGTTSKIVSTYQPAAFSALTVEIWVNNNGQTEIASSFPTVFSSSATSATNKGFQVYVNGPGTSATNPVINLGTGSAWAGYSLGPALPTSGWTHLVMTYDGANVVCYQNGVQVSSTARTGTIAADLTDFVSMGAGQAYVGLLSNAIIYTTALTADRVQAHYNAAHGAIVASNIAADTITATHILAATITAAQIAAGTITATQIAAGTIVAGIVDGTTITGATINADGPQGGYFEYAALLPTSQATPFIVAATNFVSSGTSYSATVIPVTVPLGGGIVVCVTTAAAATTVTGVTDSKGNVYRLVASNTANSQPIYVFYCQQATATLTSTDTITATTSAASAVNIYAIGGANFGNVDINFPFGGTGTGGNVGISGTPAYQNEGALIFMHNATTSPTWASGNFTQFGTTLGGSGAGFLSAGYDLTGKSLNTIQENINPGANLYSFVLISFALGQANLITSSTPAVGGFDPYANATLQGTTDYYKVPGGGYLAFNISHATAQAAMAWYTATTAGGPWTYVGSQIYGQTNGVVTLIAAGGFILQGAVGFQSVINSIGPLLIEATSAGAVLVKLPSPSQMVVSASGATGVTTAMFEVQGTVAANSIQAIVSSAAETWHNLGAPIAGWSVGTARYKMLADSGLVIAQFGNLAPPATPPADGTVIFVAANGFPAAYRTSSIVRMPAQNSAGGGGEQAGLLFNTDGSIQVFGVGGTTIARLDGTFILSTL